jgi:hypothetical protein
MDNDASREHDDILLYEAPSGLYGRAEPATAGPTAPSEPALVLYVISLFGVHNRRGERIDGDALVVRAPDLPEPKLLAAALDCADAELPALLDRGGSWAVRQIKSIDGYRLHFEPN